VTFFARKSIPLYAAASSLSLMFGLPPDKSAELLPDGPGKETVMRICSACHAMDNIRKRRLSRDAWSEKIQDMVERGAQGSDAELSEVLDYLSANFGPDSKIWVNTAPFVELKSVFELTNDEAQAIVDYRTQNGNFSQWTDLLKVPAVDRKKLEAKKDVMAF
jgi:competence protein ComEA